jgi:hypothetical protein
LSGRGIGDLVVVYLSCHGVLDRRNRLYFAAADTLKAQLGSTGIPSAWLLDQLEECRARRQVLILDCCFSGAFAHGSKGDSDLDLQQRLAGPGRGQAVLTASRAGEYSFEGQALPGAVAAGSVFTAGLVEGLRTGAADRGGDGYVSVDEAFDFASGYVQYSGASQTPQRWLYGGEGAIVLARSPAGVAVTPAPLPEALAASLDSPYPAVRIGAVSALGEWLSGADPGRALTAEQKLHQIADTDAPAVAAAARACLRGLESAGTERNGHEYLAARPATAPGTVQQSPPTADVEALAVPHGVAPITRVAERIAQSITDEDAIFIPDGDEATALAAIAGTLAATDPGRAARLLADAERIAQSITDESDKARALAAIAKALAATDPDRAERIAQSITREGWKAFALADIAKALAATDPGRAERIAQSITDKSEISKFDKAMALAAVAKALAATARRRAARLLAKAERIAKSMINEFYKVIALADIAGALAAIDPGRAARLLADAERIAQSSTDESDKARRLAVTAGALAAIDPGRAARLLADAERIAQSITDEDDEVAKADKAIALAVIAKALAATDPDRAARILAEAERIVQSITHKSYKASDKASLLAYIAEALAATDPDCAARILAEAERIAQSITDGWDKGRVLADIAAALAATIPTAPNSSPSPLPARN